LFGVESIFAVEMIETAKRAGKSIAAAILAGEREWDLAGLEFSPSEQIDPGLSSLPFVVPWVTPGVRHMRVCVAREEGLREFATLLDPMAVIAGSALLDEGVYINSGVSIGAFTKLEEGVLVNRNASVGHHSHLARYVSVGPGATVAARCTIGKGTMVGAGVVVAPGTSVGDNCVLAVGAVVTRDFPSHTLVAGNPARVVKTDISGYRDLAVP
jgi:acetyltransferase-like isoleucine patch superfamily enzyme